MARVCSPAGAIWPLGVALMLLLLACGGAGAQLAVPPALDDQFTESDNGIGLSSEILREFVGQGPSPGMTVGVEDNPVIHSTRGGKLLQDIHEDDGFEDVTVGRPSGTWARLVNVDGATYVQSTQGTTIDGIGWFSESGARIGFRLSRTTFGHIDYEDQEYTFGGTTNLFGNLFAIFPTPPPLHATTADRTVAAGIESPVARGTTAELTAGWTDSPGGVVLQDSGSATLLRLPVSQAGLQATGALVWKPRTAFQMAAAAGFGSLSGTDPIQREDDRSIGTATTRRSGESAAIAGKWLLAPSRTLLVTLSGARQNTSSTGSIASAADVGYNQPGIQGAGYRAGYDYAIDFIKADWQRRIGAAHQLEYAAAYGHVSVDYGAEVGAVDVVLPIEETADIPSTEYYGEILQAAYRFPIKREVSSYVSATQAVPGLNKPHEHAASTGTPTPPRETTGGEQFLWTVDVAF